ncbi:hypothetical protein C8R42DRAFT_687218, partial [Lentinula raphanica]
MEGHIRGKLRCILKSYQSSLTSRTTRIYILQRCPSPRCLSNDSLPHAVRLFPGRHPGRNRWARRNLEKVVDIAWQAVRFDESWMFDGLDAISLREDSKASFRN